MGFNPIDPWGIFKGVGEKNVDNTFLQNPEYPHSQDARDLWWNKLQDWGNDPNYGAISPDWNTIWDQTQQKVKQYYEGGPMAPGVQNRVDSSLARRGMSDQPAADFLHAQVGAQESQDLGSLSAQQDIAQNQFANQGRDTWLSSLQNFQAQKPAGQWQTQVSPQNPLGEMLLDGLIKGGTAVATGGISGAANDKNLAYLSSIIGGNQKSPNSYTPWTPDASGADFSPLKTNGF